MAYSYREGVVNDTDDSDDEFSKTDNLGIKSLNAKGIYQNESCRKSQFSDAGEDEDSFIEIRPRRVKPIIESDESSNSCSEDDDLDEISCITQQLSILDVEEPVYDPACSTPDASNLITHFEDVDANTLPLREKSTDSVTCSKVVITANGSDADINSAKSQVKSPGLHELELSLDKLKKAYNPSLIKNLPDKGEKLKLLIEETEVKIDLERNKSLDEKEVLQPIKRSVFDIKSDLNKEINRVYSSDDKTYFDIKTQINSNFSQFANEKLFSLNSGGSSSARINEGTRVEFRSKLRETLANIHESLKSCPRDSDTISTPEGLNINLMRHQQYALAWLLWREKQEPPGGILADEMGLGKTLSMIALILHDLNLNSISENKQEVLWFQARQDEFIQSKGTLIICPASLLGHWESELQRRVERDKIKILLYHGTNRNRSSRHLAKYDVVLTTYALVAKEVSPSKAKGKTVESVSNLVEARNEKTKGLQTILNVGWRRIILDEGHVIRNPKSQTSRSVCMLRARYRWIITGTPVHNKELDMYSLLRFLRCSPFDELYVWKNWVDNKSAAGMERMNVMMKSLLLRRVKDQVDLASGLPLVSLPSKDIHVHNVTLNEEERVIYEEVLKFSKNCLLEYMKQHQELDGNPFSKTHLAESVPSVNTVDLLVLLLRLRQICSHPALIESMLSKDDINEPQDLENTEENDDLNIIHKMNNLMIDTADVQNKLNKKLHISNPIFDNDRSSTKMKKLFKTVSKVCSNGEKVVIVSQWVSMLQIIRKHLMKDGYNICSITGNVDVRERGTIVDTFNTTSKFNVMLLSLTAGGVGLNLIGANHLILTDIHWNPQLELQASDRVHRVGQTRDVHIHKFICTSTVEEKIQLLQEKKLMLADNMLKGTKQRGPNKLTLQDLQMLFEVNTTN